MKLVSYTYDAWGNFTTTYHNSGSLTKAKNNPFTYRGYYFDADLDFYYLGTRYYDAKIGRFVNADSALYHSVYGYNMFIYCNNDPVNYVDYTGESAAAILTAAGILAASDGPLPFGDVLAGVLLVVGSAVIVADVLIKTENAAEIIVQAAEAQKPADDSPQSVTEPPATSDDVKETDESLSDKQPSTPGRMNEEIKRGQAPKDIRSAHRPHNDKNGKPHIHFKNGTSMNNDGSVHDKRNGIPQLSNKVKKWLNKHNWPTEIRIFDK